MKRFRIFSKKTIIGGSVIFISFLFILMAFAPALSGAGQTATPATAEKSYIPNPTLNSNITWNTYNSSWAPMQYNNGTGYHNLSAGYSSFYANPISINPGDIKPYTLDGKYAGANFFNTTQYDLYYSGYSHSIGNGSDGLYISGNASSTSGLNDYQVIKIPWAQMPSQDYQYIYITATLRLSSSSGSATTGQITIANSSQTGVYGQVANSKEKIYAGQSMYLSESLAQLIAGTGININSTASPYLYIGIALIQPEGTAADTPTATLTMSNFALTTYPISLGQNATGSIITQGVNNIQMKTFSPKVPMEIMNSGYSVAVSERMQNITESQASISDGSYIEEATYQGTLSLPGAPDLTYSASNITLNMTLPGKQYMVATLNGISYLSNIQAKDNGTFVFGSVNPNMPNSMILEAKYTASQWDSSTHAPSFFTLRGLEYYWWVGVIGGLSIIGLGAAAVSHFGGDEEDLKIPKGKFGR